MKVFISWSGSLSKSVATQLRDWLLCVLQGLDVFMSSEDIDSGSRWFDHIGGQLESSSFGVIVTTRENQQKTLAAIRGGGPVKVSHARSHYAPSC